jgi:hypothetical protein
MNYETLDGYYVDALTKKAVGLRHKGSPIVGRDPIWVPRSVIENGDEIEKGETDICVAEWFVRKEGLMT